MEGIRAVVRAELGPAGPIRECYRRHVGRPVNGRLVVRFTLGPDGRALDLRPVSDDFGPTGLADCIRGVLAGLEYPAPGDVPCEVVYPFSFTAGGNK